MSDAPDDSKRCPECKNTNIRLVGTRDIRAPKSGPDGPVLARASYLMSSV
jgi:hypothetical protein